MKLQRAPRLLRVVCSPSGIWDALDLEADEATATERIYVYQLDGTELVGHVCCRSAKPGNRCSLTASYRLVHEQPADEQVRTTAAWTLWVSITEER